MMTSRTRSLPIPALPHIRSRLQPRSARPNLILLFHFRRPVTTAYARHPRHPQEPPRVPSPPTVELPAQVQKWYGSIPCLQLDGGGGDADGAGSGSGSVKTYPPPPPDELVAAHELFAVCSLHTRVSKIVFLRSIPNIPDIILLGRARGGKSNLLQRLADVHLKSVPSFRVARKMFPSDQVFARPECVFYGFQSKTSIGDKEHPSLRVLDGPGYGHTSKLMRILPELGLMMQKRKMMRGAALIVQAPIGIVDEDLDALQQLLKRGIPFVVVLDNASSFVPAPAEPDFPPGLWDELMSAVRDIRAKIDGQGAAGLFRGTFATGNGRYQGGGTMGMLGVKWALARMCGLVGTDDWGRPLGPGSTPLTLPQPEETPVAVAVAMAEKGTSDGDGVLAAENKKLWAPKWDDDDDGGGGGGGGRGGNPPRQAAERQATIANLRQMMMANLERGRIVGTAAERDRRHRSDDKTMDALIKSETGLDSGVKFKTGPRDGNVWRLSGGGQGPGGSRGWQLPGTKIQQDAIKAEARQRRSAGRNDTWKYEQEDGQKSQHDPEDEDGYDDEEEDDDDDKYEDEDEDDQGMKEMDKEIWDAVENKMSVDRAKQWKKPQLAQRGQKGRPKWRK